ncbi:metallophosphoesterase [Methanobacterium alcaliphilum]|uniref:metallophosphoesterase n=1 Tax=Methanobacterium alcaliphilum TaxID=392018 RepID=UPI00200B7538|nr:metallophosphoesterase [Methanobacterium alcaliphilum]MCK9151196.1 metallophosphoesterase [Methanobacterium alcaliphilum]
MKKNQSPGTVLTDNISIVDLSLKIGDYLIISDLHFGYEHSLNRDGLMIPKFQFEKILDRLESINSTVKSKKIVINGDLKHDFGKINRQEWKEVHSFLSFIEDNFEEIILIKGNHDNFTPYIARKFDLDLKETFRFDNNLILHGHFIPENINELSDENIIIGHEHPCIGLRSGERVEKIKCFLKGSFNEKNLIVMPSFNFVSEGSDVLHEKLLSPFLKKSSINEFEAYGVENFEVFPFGKIKNIINASQRFV